MLIKNKFNSLTNLQEKELKILDKEIFSKTEKNNYQIAELVTKTQFDSLKTHLEIALTANILNKLNQSQKEDKNKKFKSPKDIFVSWSKRTDVNGYGKIFEYENIFIKLFWLLVFSASLITTFWLIGLNILAYLEFGVVSTIGVVYEKPTEFPAVTFCDNNAFTAQKGQELISNLSKSPECKGNMSCAVLLAFSKASDPSYGDENRKKLGLNKNQIDCKYNGNDCKKDLDWYWSFYFGNCFQFNVGLNDKNRVIKKRMADKAGYMYGILLTINNFTNTNFTNYLNGGLGMIVFIHNSSFHPRDDMDGVFAKPGEESYIGIKRTFIKNEPKPYTQCQDLTSYSSDLFDFIIKSNRTYRQKDCFDLCTQKLIISQCGCYSMRYPNPRLKLNEIRTCMTLSDWSCVLNSTYKVDLVKCASESCPLECNFVQYDLTASSLTTPTINDYVASSMSDLVSYDEWRTQSVKIYIFYSQLEYTFLKEEPALTLISLISNIGGTLGLIVSVSFFSIFELGEALALILHAIVFGKKSQQKN